MTERVHGGRDMETDTKFGRPGFGPVELTRPQSDGPGRLQRPVMGTDTVSDIPIRNAQRGTFNSQLLDMGTDTIFDIPVRNVQRPTLNSQLSMG